TTPSVQDPREAEGPMLDQDTEFPISSAELESPITPAAGESWFHETSPGEFRTWWESQWPAAFDADEFPGVVILPVSAYWDQDLPSWLRPETARFSRAVLKARIESLFVYHRRRGGFGLVARRSSRKPDWVQALEALGTSQPNARELASLIRTLKSLLSEGKY